MAGGAVAARGVTPPVIKVQRPPRTPKDVTLTRRVSLCLNYVQILMILISSTSFKFTLHYAFFKAQKMEKYHLLIL